MKAREAGETSSKLLNELVCITDEPETKKNNKELEHIWYIKEIIEVTFCFQGQCQKYLLESKREKLARFTLD